MADIEISDESEDEADGEKPAGNGMTIDDYKRLTGRDQWLNCKILDEYLKLLLQSKPKESQDVVVFNSHFMEKLAKGEAVGHWHRKVDLFGSLLFFVINPGGHWTFMLVDVLRKKMVYYDSLGGSGQSYIHAIKQYLAKESLKRVGHELLWCGWNFCAAEDIPRQTNGSDCGVFLLEYIRCILFSQPMNFTQRQMGDIRDRITNELKNNSVFPPKECSNSKLDDGDSDVPSSSEQDTGNDIKDMSNFSEMEEGITVTSSDSEMHDTCEKPGLESEVSQHMQMNEPICWNELDECLQTVFPSNSKFTYMVEEFSRLPKESFCGAPSVSFEIFVRINLKTEQDVKHWIEELQNQSKCTYRVTRTYKPSLKRVRYKVDMHCQHFRKNLTSKQIHAQASKHKSKESLVSDIRKKKTQCPSTLSLTLQVPSKLLQVKKSKYISNVAEHQAVVKLKFNHNHPVDAAHVLSFRPIAPETKEKYLSLFRLGHSAASARHYYENMILEANPDSVQLTLADRAVNPTAKDISNLYSKWRTEEMGGDNGPDLFDRLEQEISSYNEKFGSSGGKAILQKYDNETEEQSDSDEFQEPKRKKPKWEKSCIQPMVLAVCTPLMARVHEHIPQSAELLYCDATSSLDRFNTSLFLLSTSHPAGGIPLGVVLTSDEREETIHKGINMLQSILPQKAFYGNGAQKGPSLIMTDDSNTEKSALAQVWPMSQQLLCTFHFLQRRWTWLWDGKNRILNSDRAILIKQVKELVYASSDMLLNQKYQEFHAHLTVAKYPHFLQHMQSLWPRRHEWAICYRIGIPIRGNQTNNYSEAGIRILKDLIFSRVKAYNLVQMFLFITEALELYHQRRLLSVAHNRLDHYVSIKFRGLNFTKVKKEHIKPLEDDDDQFMVKSSRDPDSEYLVDLALGTCTCPQGSDGSPCSHQAAIAVHFKRASLNCIPTMHPVSRKMLAHIALGDVALGDIAFYASVSQQEDEKENPTNSGFSNSPDDPDFSASCWSCIREGARDEQEDSTLSQDNGSCVEILFAKLDRITSDLKTKLAANDPQLTAGVEKFVDRYDKLAQTSTARLSSAFHRFGSTSTTTTSQLTRYGRRIPVQATAAGRRRKGISRGKARIPVGRPVNALKDISKGVCNVTRYSLPTRREPKGKRPHNISANIDAGRQNAGKW